MTNTKTLSEQVNDLATNLISLYESGVIHETILDQVDEVMATIYKEENMELNEADGNYDPDDEDYCPTSPAYMLFNYVENEEQFVEDYRNAISQSVKSDMYIDDFEKAAQEIINRRS